MENTATKEEGKPALVPKLRFPEFQDSDEWQTKLLGDLCKIRTGKKDANEGAADGTYPFFTCAENHIYSRTYSFDTEAILVAGNANVGQTKYYNGKFEAYQRTYILTDFSGISVPYLYAILNANLRESLLGQVQVSAMSYIKLPMLQVYGLPVPPTTAEQQKIAECLSSVDELIAAQARKLDALKTHKKGLMQQLFPREGETQPLLRFPEFQNAGEWEQTSLGAACHMQAGKFVSASEIREQNAEGLFPCYGGNGLRGYTTTFTHSGKYPLIGRQGALCGNVKLGLGSFHATEHAVVVTPKNGIAADWLFYLLDFLNLNQYATGQAQPGLSVDVLEKVAVALPHQKAEQQRIADCLTRLDDLIAAETQKIESFKTHKKGLMQQLFPYPGGGRGRSTSMGVESALPGRFAFH
jgi:type I restriction enzyme S subunit